ncbi:hypothetical protein F5876DRAFT_68726 [Lentinula aff. lateritia]|uniref:Uncharacterized protein n=1 Tax=Lentinula aff. lateritia TaxID=2804960 RepID=A0ACC1TQP3_9AGAR|nr:hypothetical protein F5876DRAFT_68726 [Lentinula aff. lateritia]
MEPDYVETSSQFHTTSNSGSVTHDSESTFQWNWYRNQTYEYYRYVKDNETGMMKKVYDDPHLHVGDAPKKGILSPGSIETTSQNLLASRKSTPVSFEPIQKPPKYFMEGKELPFIESGSYGPTKLETTNFNSKDSQGITAWYYGQAPHNLDHPPEDTPTPPKQGTIYVHRNIADGGYQIWIWLAQSEREIWFPVDLNGALVHHPEIPARVLTLQASTGNPSWTISDRTRGDICRLNVLNIDFCDYNRTSENRAARSGTSNQNMSTSPITNLNPPAMQNSGGDLSTCSEAVSSDLSRSSQPYPPDLQTSRNDPQAQDNSSSEPKDNMSTDHGDRIKRSKRHHRHQNNTSKDVIVRFCVNESCSNPIPPNQSYKKCRACRRAYRISVTKIILLLCADDVVLLSFLLGAVTKLVLHVLNVTENGAVKDLLWHHKGLRMKWTTLKMRWTILKMITDIMHETEPNHDSDNNEEIPRQVSESHNLNARVKTTLFPVEQDNQQRANSINEPLNDVDSDINYFLDVNSSEYQFKKNERTDAKQENERLRRELKELKSQMSAGIRRDIAEHTHLNVLNRLLIQTRSEYSQNKLSQSAVTETLDNLSSQLRDLADRRLENMPVGLGRILDLIKTSEIDNDESPSKKQQHS